MPRHLKSKRSAALEAVTQILGSDNLMHDIGQGIGLMVIAEDVISSTQCTAEQDRAAFGLMCPSPVLRGKCDTVHREGQVHDDFDMVQRKCAVPDRKVAS